MRTTKRSRLIGQYVGQYDGIECQEPALIVIFASTMRGRLSWLFDTGAYVHFIAKKVQFSTAATFCVCVCVCVCVSEKDER